MIHSAILTQVTTVTRHRVLRTVNRLHVVCYAVKQTVCYSYFVLLQLTLVNIKRRVLRDLSLQIQRETKLNLWCICKRLPGRTWDHRGKAWRCRSYRRGLGRCTPGDQNSGCREPEVRRPSSRRSRSLVLHSDWCSCGRSGRVRRRQPRLPRTWLAGTPTDTEHTPSTVPLRLHSTTPTYRRWWRRNSWQLTSGVDKWVAGLLIGCVLKWRHLVNACEVKAHLIRCWQNLGAVCFWQPGCCCCPAWQSVSCHCCPAWQAVICCISCKVERFVLTTIKRISSSLLLTVLTITRVFCGYTDDRARDRYVHVAVQYRTRPLDIASSSEHYTID